MTVVIYVCSCIAWGHGGNCHSKLLLNTKALVQCWHCREGNIFGAKLFLLLKCVLYAFGSVNQLDEMVVNSYSSVGTRTDPCFCWSEVFFWCQQGSIPFIVFKTADKKSVSVFSNSLCFSSMKLLHGLVKMFLNILVLTHTHIVMRNSGQHRIKC